MARVRERIVPGPVGGVRWDSHSASNNPTAQYALRDYCSDSLGSQTDHALELSHRDNRAMVPLNGSIGSNVTFTNGTTIQWNPTSHLSLSFTSEAEAMTRALARSNPSRAVVSIPNFVHELKDLPGMFRDIVAIKSQLKRLSWRATPKQVANHYLAHQFGWVPLVNDIRNLLNFTEVVDRRVNELERLYSRGGLKRRIQLDQDTKELVGSNEFIHSITGRVLTAKRQRITTGRRWATVRWYPTSLPKSRTPESTRQLAKELVLGLHRLSPVQVWNAVPWTWLADWTSNVGDFLQANDNTIPCAHGPVNLMTYRKTTETWVRTDSYTTVSGGIGTRTFEQKNRSIGGSALTAYLPFLSGRQLSILGALAIQQVRWRR